MDTGSQNEIWAKKLIDGLVAQGVDYFCAAPGSRSTTLSLAIANHPKAKWTVHFDERGLCFHALGYIKSAKKPAVVMATSGTAIGNLMPAIMEASNERIPLIILSADRPPELRDCGANQTVDQVKLFHSFVRWQIDLPCPEDRLSDRYLASTINQAVLMATQAPAGPVHLNCMFREPLFGSHLQSATLNHHVHHMPTQLVASKDTIDFWAEKLSEKRRGVILVGSCSDDLKDVVFPLAEKLKWPIFADVLSSLRSTHNHPCLISHFDPILKLKNAMRADAIIQFGNRFVSKTLSMWLEKQTPEFYLHVSDHSMRQDPMHLITHRVIADPLSFSNELKKSLSSQNELEWVEQWSQWDHSCKLKLHEFFTQNSNITEPGLIWEIASQLPEDWNLFLANSMPIRDANQFFSPMLHQGSIFGNRGVSGIDGNLATACGLAKGNEKPTFAIVGDLTFLHDLNSLALVAKSEVPIVICVVNNRGGGIFSFLPVSKRREAFEEFIAASHEIHLEAAAKLFDLPYFHPKTRAEFADLIKSQKQSSCSCVIEITTDRVENVHIHEQIIQAIAPCLNSADLPLEIPTTLH